MVRLLAFILIIASVSVIPFVFWGQDFERLLTIDGSAEWMRGFGSWAWLIGIALIASDIALPVPATGIMAALGIIYGPFWGGLVSAGGSILAGVFGYGVCRLVKEETAQKLAGAQNMAFVKNLFDVWGGWIVVASRWLPVLPETISFLAGLVRMPFIKFFIALACGAVPMAFMFAWVGHVGADRPVLTILICAIAPLLLWLVAKPVLMKLTTENS